MRRQGDAAMFKPGMFDKEKRRSDDKSLRRRVALSPRLLNQVLFQKKSILTFFRLSGTICENRCLII